MTIWQLQLQVTHFMILKTKNNIITLSLYNHIIKISVLKYRYIHVLRFPQKLWSDKNIKVLTFKKDWDELQEKFCLHKKWRKESMRQSKKFNQMDLSNGPRNFDIYFCVISNCYNQDFISGKRTGHYALPPSNFYWYFLVS